MSEKLYVKKKELVNKSLTIIITIILLMSLNGCSQEINREDLIGTWFLQKVEKGNDSSTFYNYQDCFSMEFIDDGKMVNNNNVSSTKGTWKLQDNLLDCKNSLNDGTIENINFDIKNVSDNELIMLDIKNNKLLYFTHTCDSH